MNWKENWLNITTKNQWDIGWPCSPRLMFWMVMIAVAIALIIFL